MSDTGTILSVKGLHVAFDGQPVVKDVSFDLRPGLCIGLVGASGSGKSVTSLALMGLLPGNAIVKGSIRLTGDDGPVELTDLDPERLRRHRGRDLAMVFQEPMTALDPVYRVGDQVAEAMREHLGIGRREARNRVVELFHEVRLPDPEALYDRYPHQLSGGQKQRVVIALALSCGPKVLICDEPTTALDVLVQRDVLILLKDLQRTRHMGMLFITHDLGVVREVADEVLVMHRGKVVEQAPVERLFSDPQHPYTRGLLACRPGRTQPRKLPTVDDFLRGELPPGTQELVSDESRRQHLEKLMAGPPLLRVKGLAKDFPAAGGARKPVLHDLTFEVFPGESLGIVGGSGSGKTTLGRSILRLVEPGAGEVVYRGTDLRQLDDRGMRAMRRELQLIFQDPYSSLNPRLTVGGAITEAMAVHGIGSHARERRERAMALLDRVGLEAAHFDRFPHQFSGGQRQRIVIARTLALEPRLIVCDESIAALDVSVQAQVLNLLNDLKEEHGLTYLFISHDLNVVRYMCDRILVLEQGHIAELGPSDDLYEHPQAEYTRRLLSAVMTGDRQ